jgi:hypothetical protein
MYNPTPTATNSSTPMKTALPTQGWLLEFSGWSGRCNSDEGCPSGLWEEVGFVDCWRCDESIGNFSHEAVDRLIADQQLPSGDVDQANLADKIAQRSVQCTISARKEAVEEVRS